MYSRSSHRGDTSSVTQRHPERFGVVERAKRQTFDHLTAVEKATVGTPSEYEWDQAVRAAPKRRTHSTQFSLRLEKTLSEALETIARERDLSFSEVVRDAISYYLGGPTGSPVETKIYDVTGTGINLTFATSGYAGRPVAWPQGEAVPLRERATGADLVETHLWPR
jgi:predicted HicB family RNase H-like nuclease